MHISSLKLRTTIYLAKNAQIALLLAKKVTVLSKYLDFADVFLEESANVFLEQTGVNDQIIELKKGKEPPYGSIYSLDSLSLKFSKPILSQSGQRFYSDFKIVN